MAAGTFAAVLPGSAQTAGTVNSGLFPATQHAGVSGEVRDRTGAPQMGVLVELLDPWYNVIARTLTDEQGRYTLPRLRAGLYQIKASDALFLTTLRPNLRLLTNSRAVVNLTLSTLYQALQWLPATPRTLDSRQDDWDWTLRLSANRPLLRMFDPGTVQVADVAGPASEGTGGPVMIQSGDGAPTGDTRHQVLLAEGPRSFGQGGVVEQFVTTAGDGETRTLLFGAESSTDASGMGRLGTTAAYRQQLTPDRSMLTVVTLADRPQIAGASGSGLVTMHLRTASTVELGPAATLSAGTELAVARFGEGDTAFAGHPFAEFAVHAGQTTLAYGLSTAPTMTSADQMEHEAQADAPAVVEQDGTLYLEQGLHQQLTVTHEQHHWTEQAGFFEDSLNHPVVQGALAGEQAEFDSSDVLYDPGTGTIAVSGAGYRRAGGVLAMLRDQLDANTWLSLRYALGEAISLPGAGPGGSSLTAFDAPFAKGHSSMLAIAAGGRIPGTETLIRASYRWQPVSTLTQVAPFDPEVPEAYLSFALRQPLRMERLGSGHVEAIVDVRNLLAQGYRPFLSQDGTMVYFAQAQRCIAAGLAFSF